MNIHKQVVDYKFFTKTIVDKNIKTFHHHTFLLKSLIETHFYMPIKYLEIGSYFGSTLILTSLLERVEISVGIDPLVLPNQEREINENLKNFGDFSKIQLIKGYSSNVVKTLNDTYDVIFIDGDHTYNAVIEDFTNYDKILNKGGLIVFDDYNDYKYSKDVKKAVDYLNNNGYFRDYEVSGDFDVIDGVHDSGLALNRSNLFYIKKN